MFCTRNRYLNAFRSNFKKFQKNRFFGDFHLWDPKMWTCRIFYGSQNFDVEIFTGPNTSKLFEKKMGQVNSMYFAKCSKICGISLFSQKGYNVHMWTQLTYLSELLKSGNFFGKYEISSFSQYIHCKGYFDHRKTYGNLKMIWGTFNHLFIDASYADSTGK